MWYLLYGPDALARDDEVTRMKHGLGDGDAQLNVTVFDSTALLKEIQAACDAVGFFVEKRLVIVKHWLSKSDLPKRNKGKADDDVIAKLIKWLPDLSEATELVFVEDDALAESHPLMKLSKAKAGGGQVQFFDMPENPVNWIMARVKLRKGQMLPQAAQVLANRIHRGNKYDRDHFAEDSRLYLRKLDNEIEKLTAYANGRPITPDDVAALVAEEDVADMFGLMDAISQRRLADAYALMRGVLVRGEAPQVVLTMLSRQTRMLLIAKENERAPNLADLLGVKPFAVSKLLDQARRFSLADLEQAHRAALAADVAIKTGQMEDVVALDVLLAEIGGADR